MNLSNAGTLEAIAPELIALSVQIVIYYILTSAAVYLENRVIRADQAR